METRPKITRILLAILLILISIPVSALPLFESDRPLEIELIGPMSRLIDNGDDSEEAPFILRAEGVEHPVGIRVRGKSRLRICDFPPLRINFESNRTEGTVFAGQNHLKLVAHCRGTTSFEVNILEEFAAYRIFGLLSEKAYRVRLARISYIDSESRLGEKHQHRFGFVIEPTEALATRIGGEEVQLTGVRLSELNPDQAALVYVYQFLIGNTDWSLVSPIDDEICCHNGRLIEKDAEIFYIPYDFDLSGLVNASYARPDPSLHINNVRQRRYRGFCTDPVVLERALRTVKSREAEIFAVMTEIAAYTHQDLNKAEKYLSQFFAKAAKEVKLLNEFEKRCIE